MKNKWQLLSKKWRIFRRTLTATTIPKITKTNKKATKKEPSDSMIKMMKTTISILTTTINHVAESIFSLPLRSIISTKWWSLKAQ